MKKLFMFSTIFLLFGLSIPQQSVDADQLSVEATNTESSLINLTRFVGQRSQCANGKLERSFVRTLFNIWHL